MPNKEWTWNLRLATKYRIRRMTRIADLCASVNLQHQQQQTWQRTNKGKWCKVTPFYASAPPQVGARPNNIKHLTSLCRIRIGLSLLVLISTISSGKFTAKWRRKKGQKSTEKNALKNLQNCQGVIWFCLRIGLQCIKRGLARACMSWRWLNGASKTRPDSAAPVTNFGPFEGADFKVCSLFLLIFFFWSLCSIFLSA